MLLIYCKSCFDVVAVHEKYRACGCGKSGGACDETPFATVDGDAVALAFDNNSFREALTSESHTGRGRFEAFVLPTLCSRIHHMEGGN